MSIATRTGDDGTTGLMYNRRVAKTDPRVEAYGTVDELNAALGLARSLAQDAWLHGELLATQKDLVTIMGELATHRDDFDRYVRDDYPLFKSALTARLDGLVAQIEAQKVSFHGWATPGANPLAASIDVARTVCRRAERRICALNEAGELRESTVILYFNRLSDVLWLFARWVETRSAASQENSE
jgi:cob(I)alamin adenosyltransferase